MTTDLFIRTYDKDALWLRYCLRSLEKFASGFNARVIVTPKASHRTICPIAQEFGWSYDLCPLMADDDYVGQQGTKMTADKWCSGEVICFVDSDLVFTRPFTPEDLVAPDGRVQLLKTRYSAFESPWQPITESVVGFPVEWEYMRRMPLAYPNDNLKLTRGHIERTQGMPFEEFIRRVPQRDFSEFNALGAVAEKFTPEKFAWLDTESGEPLPPPSAKQFWSWGGFSTEIEQEIENALK